MAQGKMVVVVLVASLLAVASAGGAGDPAVACYTKCGKKCVAGGSGGKVCNKLCFKICGESAYVAIHGARSAAVAKPEVQAELAQDDAAFDEPTEGVQRKPAGSSAAGACYGDCAKHCHNMKGHENYDQSQGICSAMCTSICDASNSGALVVPGVNGPKPRSKQAANKSMAALRASAGVKTK